MLEEFESGHSVPRDDYEARVPQLRVDLINAQYDLREADFSLLVLIAGNDRLGINDLVQRIHEWMDARYLVTRAFDLPSDAELERPRAWRYWRESPRAGRIGLFIGGWANSAIADRALGEIGKREFERATLHGERMEQALADDGTLVLKFWLHVPEEELAKRFKRAKKEKRVDERDRRMLEHYDERVRLAERLIDRAKLPWTIVESLDERHRDLAVGQAIADSLSERLTESKPDPERAAPASVTPPASRNASALDGVDLSVALTREDYRERLDELQLELVRCAAKLRRAGISTLLAFEGWDAAGKGGAIRRVTQPLDVRDYRIIPIAAPTAEELQHHYLWRFWRVLPRAGRLLVFDRSWYGRVLVERVEGFASEPEWRRAYDEINDFEAQLVEHGSVFCKFWLHIDPDEQLRRFQARELTPYKKYKITGDDYRNRERWNDYALAVDEMVERTGAKPAPWTLVAANDKRWARVQVLETVCSAMTSALERR